MVEPNARYNGDIILVADGSDRCRAAACFPVYVGADADYGGCRPISAPIDLTAAYLP